MSQEEEASDAREVAYLVAKGLTPDIVAQKTDQPLNYVEKLTELDIFTQVLGEVGGDAALRSWNEYKIERRSQASLRTSVRARIDDYFKELDAIAMDHKVKPEIRKDIMFRLMDQAGVSKDQGDSVHTMELPPSFFTALAEANKEVA